MKLYEIVPIRLDLLYNWSCDFMTLQLPSILNVNFAECIVFEIMALVGKKLLKPSRRLRKEPCIQLVKKPPKLDEKTRIENQRRD